MLACELARRKVPCRIIDRSEQPFPGSRAKGLQPRTLEVLDNLGVIDAVLGAGEPFPKFRIYDGERVQAERSLHEMIALPYTPAMLASAPYPQAWLLPQWKTDEILREHLRALGVTVDRPAALIEIEPDGEGVVAVVQRAGTIERIHASYLVGCDGGRSQVRKSLGISFEGETLAAEHTLIGDVRINALLERGYCHTFTRSGDTNERVSLWPLPNSDLLQFVATVKADDAPSLNLSTLQSIFNERSGRKDISLLEVAWLSLYRVNVRLADRFRAGRIFLAGDAAHVHSSAGGQGLNTSVQDAFNLGWKLAGVMKGAAPSLLDTYEAERLPMASALLNVTSRLHQSQFDAAQISADLYQLNYHYRGSGLSRQDDKCAGALRAGDRAPDARCVMAGGKPARLFELFRPPGFKLLVFGAVDESARGCLLKQAESGLQVYFVVGDTALHEGEVGDPSGQMRQAYAIKGSQTSLVLVRPDAYIGLITQDLSGDDLGSYRQMLNGWSCFGSGHTPRSTASPA